MYLRKKLACLLMLAVFAVPVLLSDSFSESDNYTEERREMVERDLKGRGISDEKVLQTMSKIKRHLFVDKKYWDEAYDDHPLPIDEGQTISQPYVVAMMTEALKLKQSDKVLEIGTGSGYQAAVLAGIVDEVYSVEIRKKLAEQAEKRLRTLGYQNVRVRHADGYYGWQKYAPFDAIIVTASANHIPPPLIKQLREGGRLIIPLGSTLYYQVLTLGTKKEGELKIRQLAPVAFVPMTGEVRKSD